MLTRRIDSAFDALVDCRVRVLSLRDLYSPGSPERVALDGLMEALSHTNEALFDGRARLEAPPAYRAGFEGQDSR